MKLVVQYVSNDQLTQVYVFNLVDHTDFTWYFAFEQVTAFIDIAKAEIQKHQSRYVDITLHVNQDNLLRSRQIKSSSNPSSDGMFPVKRLRPVMMRWMSENDTLVLVNQSKSQKDQFQVEKRLQTYLNLKSLHLVNFSLPLRDLL